MAKSDIHHASSVLCRTRDGHALIDAHQSYVRGYDKAWLLKMAAPPVAVYNTEAESDNASQPRKRRKVTDTSSHTDLDAHTLAHQALLHWLQPAVQHVRQEWISTHPRPTNWHLQPVHAAVLETTSALDLRQLIAAMDDVGDMVGDGIAARDAVIMTDARSETPLARLVNRMHVNDGEHCLVLQSSSAKYLLPPRSGWILAQMHRWKDILLAERKQLEAGFDLVVLDPPWPNRSAQRSSQYEVMDIYDLYQIDLSRLLCCAFQPRPTLVAVWVTNHVKYRKFVGNKLFPAWNITDTKSWYWVKVTAAPSGGDLAAAGLPVWTLNGTSPRRAYEGLMLGWHLPGGCQIQPPTIPDEIAFLSTPSAHSRKPWLLDLLRPYLLGTPLRAMELFSRFLQAGVGPDSFTLSLGNECLKFNEIPLHWSPSQRAPVS